MVFVEDQSTLARFPTLRGEELEVMPGEKDRRKDRSAHPEADAFLRHVQMQFAAK